MAQEIGEGNTGLQDLVRKNAKTTGINTITGHIDDLLAPHLDEYHRLFTRLGSLEKGKGLELTPEEIKFISDHLDAFDGMLYFHIRRADLKKAKDYLFQSSGLSLDFLRSRDGYESILSDALDGMRSKGWKVTQEQGGFVFSRKAEELIPLVDTYFKNLGLPIFTGIISDAIIDAEDRYQDLKNRVQSEQYIPSPDDNQFFNNHIRKVPSEKKGQPGREEFFLRIDRDQLKGIFSIFSDYSPWKDFEDLRERYTSGDFLHPLILQVANELMADPNVAWRLQESEGEVNHAGLYKSYIFVPVEKTQTLTDRLKSKLAKVFGG